MAKPARTLKFLMFALILAVVLHPVRNFKSIESMVFEISKAGSGGARNPASAVTTNRPQPAIKYFKFRSGAELMRLSPLSRQVYVSEVRDAIMELSEMLDKETEFDSAAKKAFFEKYRAVFGSESAHALTSGTPVSATVGTDSAQASATGPTQAEISSQPLAAAAAPSVAAVGSGKSCIYAGWVLQYAGRYCAHPPKSDKCHSGQVQCNPMVFGDGVCASIGRAATSQCFAKRKPTAEVVKFIEANLETWNKLKADLDSYCPSEKQQAICRMLQRRIAAIEPSVSGEPPKAEGPAGVVSEVVRSSAGQPSATVDRVGVASLPLPAAENSASSSATQSGAVAPSPLSIDESQKEPGLHFKGQRKCIWSELLFDFRTERKVGKPVVSYGFARQIACANNTFAPEMVQRVRERYKKSKIQVANATGVDKEVLLAWNKRAYDNFEACASYAESRPATFEHPLYDENVELVYDQKDFTQGRGIHNIWGYDDVEFGSQLATQGIHLCSTRLHAPNGAPARSQRGVD